jgi:hypothetical protein
MQSTQIYGDDKRHGYRGLYPLRAANLIHPDRVEARKGSIARLRLERKPGDQTTTVSYRRLMPPTRWGPKADPSTLLSIGIQI